MSEAEPQATPEPPPPPKKDSGKKGGLKKESIWEVYFPRKVHDDVEAIPVASFPMIIYFWPAMIAFLFCGLVQGGAEEQSIALGRIATACLAFNLMVIVTALDQKKFIIAGLAVVVIGLALWISNLKDFAIATSIGGWLGGLEITYATDTYLVIFVLLLFFFLLGMITPRVNYWRLEPNEFVHYVQPWGRDQSIPRQGSTVTREVPDVFELLLTFGGGSLVIRREGQVVARIKHVPFLGRRMVAIEKMLGVTRVRAVGDGGE